MARFTVSENLTEYLHQLNWNNKLAVATSFDRIRNDRVFSKSVYCFDESNNIQTYPLKMFMQKDFPFQRELNKFIKNIEENGLSVKWRKGHIFGSFAEKPPKFSSYFVSFEVISVLVFICIILLFSAVLILFFEFLIYKKVRTPGTARLWRFIEMAIDPYRYFLLNDFIY